MFRDASNLDSQIVGTSVGIGQASQLAKLMADNAALRSELDRQALQVTNAQQATTEAASRWASEARSDVVPVPFMTQTDVEAVN